MLSPTRQGKPVNHQGPNVGCYVEQVLNGNKLMTRRVYRFVEKINEKILPRRGYPKPRFNAWLSANGSPIRGKNIAFCISTKG
jgi:hypothetical protein